MVTTITATELARNLSGILNRARYKGERFIIKGNGEAVAILEPIVPRSVSLRQIAAQLATAGTKIDAHDIQVATTALAYDYAVLTDNVRDFERVPGLTVRQPQWPQ